MRGYKKIVIYSATRTGSSLVYNVFRFLFQNEASLSSRHDKFNLASSVLKTHNHKKLGVLRNHNVLYVVPIRDPLQASISMYRIYPRQTRDTQNYCKSLIDRQLIHLTIAEKLQGAGRDVVFLRYEDFENNVDYLIDFIENYFSISVFPLDKDRMKKGYDKENVYASTKNIPDFMNYLPISGFHGNHVTREKFTPPEDVLYWLNYYLGHAKPAFKKYGYFSE